MDRNILKGLIFNEYVVMLSPHSDLSDKIMQLKEDFARQYMCSQILKSRPKVTLLKFVQSQMAEDRILNRLKYIFEAEHPFAVNLSNFGCLPTHTIFINIVSQVKIKELITELKSMTKWLTINKEYKPHFISNPYVVLASGLKSWQYEKALPEYEKALFTGMFMAEEVTVLKRPAHSDKNYTVVGKYPLLNTSPVSKSGIQTSLF